MRTNPAVVYAPGPWDVHALRAAGVADKMIFVDQASGARSERKGLAALLAAAQAGDRIVCWRFDRLRRSVSHLCTLMERFQRDGIALRSLVVLRAPASKPWSRSIVTTWLEPESAAACSAVAPVPARP